VQPERGALGVRRELGRDPRQSDVEGLEEGSEGLSQLGLEDVTVGLEPISSIVARQIAKKSDRGRTEAIEFSYGRRHSLQVAQARRVAPVVKSFAID
jgi:hypothetical protein